uniref:Uncharacterized protein n=1 Tax=Amphimedon queenslandica TaxID=400682 RepID=A0A1X7TWH5_AMPQE
HLSLGIHTVMIIGRTPSGVETAKLVQFEIKEGFNEYCTDPNVIGIASTVLHCHLNLSQGTAPYTVAVSTNCNREATVNCSIANLPSHQCNGSLYIQYLITLSWLLSVQIRGS